MSGTEILYLGDGTPTGASLRVGAPPVSTSVHIEETFVGSGVWRLADWVYPLYQPDLVTWRPNDMAHFGGPFGPGPVNYHAVPAKLHYQLYTGVKAFWDLGAVTWGGDKWNDETHMMDTLTLGAGVLDSNAKVEVTWYGEPTPGVEFTGFDYTSTDTPDLGAISGSADLPLRAGMHAEGTNRVDQVSLTLTLKIPGSEGASDMWVIGGTVGPLLRLEFDDAPPPPAPTPTIGAGDITVGLVRMG